VYQHLGVRRRKAGFGTDSYERNRPPYLDSREAGALRALADEYHRGRVFVTTTARLLTYNFVNRGLCWRAEEDAGRTMILIHGVRHAAGDTRPLTREDMEGLTFYTDQPERTEVYLEESGARVRVDDVKVNPPDQTGRPSIMVNLHPPEYVEPSK
jgi:hypothetical protein